MFSNTAGQNDWLAISATFFGYCAGNTVIAFNLIPLISASSRNHFGLLAIALLLTATAPTPQNFAASCLLLGFGASVASRLLGLAAVRVGPNREGKAIATCIATAMMAVLSLRVWGPYLASATACRVILAIMATPFVAWFIRGWTAPSVPVAKGEQDVPLNMKFLLLQSVKLRRAIAQQATVFASYNAAWVLLAAEAAPAERAAASFCGSLAGIATLIASGVLVGRRCGSLTHLVGNTVMLVLGCPLLLLAYAGLTDPESFVVPNTLLAFCSGMAFIDAGMQLTLVSNQTRIQAIVPTSKGRLASLLTISSSLGGALGGGASRWLWHYYGWSASLTLVLITAAIGLLVAFAPEGTRNFMLERRRKYKGSSPFRITFRIQTAFRANR